MDEIVKLGQLLSQTLESIEIIPGDGSEWFISSDFERDQWRPFLFQDRNLGIPEHVLYKIYMVASVKFPSVRTAYCTSAIKYPVRQFDNSIPKSTINPVLLTSVLLLANSAHQSALNLRKDLIGHHELSVEDDFRFFDRIMTIKQCAKSSILWHHRRWLFARMYLPAPAVERTFLDNKLEIRQLRKAPFTDDDMCSLRLPPSVITRELELITKACEVYPRNYHAWYHRHLIISSCITQARVLLQEQLQQSDSTSRSSLRAVSQSELNSFLSKNGFLAVLLHELESMKIYIDRHVSDCTAMGYLCDLRRDCLDLIKLEETNNILQHAQELLRTYPERESTWLYLRRTYSSFSRDEELRSLTEQVLRSLPSTPGKERCIEQGLRTIIFTHVKDGSITELPQILRALNAGNHSGAVEHLMKLGIINEATAQSLLKES